MPVAIPLIPYGRHSISDADVEAVIETLRSNFLTGGPRVEEFERAFADEVGAEHAVAVNSATAALHLAMLCVGIRAGDRVVTSPNTFLASANCAAFVGAVPDFADIDPVSYNLDPAALERMWTSDIKAVVAVDYAGQSCDLPALAPLARGRGAVVIEDACHGVGGGFVHRDRVWKTGGHPLADITVFSFHPVKTMTTGEGGMLVTNDRGWAQKARALRSHGVVREPARFLGLGAADAQPTAPVFPWQSEQGPWYYEMQELGHNFRLTDIQCALGHSQLRRLQQFNARRREIVALYNQELRGLPWLITPGVRDQRNVAEIGWHLYTVQIDFTAIGKSRTAVMTELRSLGIGTQVLYIPVYLQPWYRKNFGYTWGKCPIAEEFYGKALSLPLFPEMSGSDIARVVDAVKSIVK